MHEGFQIFTDGSVRGAQENSYCIKHIKHATYLFPWNDDIKGVMKIIMDACRPLKLLLDYLLMNIQIILPKIIK